MNTASATIAEKILAFLDPFVRRTYNEIAEGIGEDPHATHVTLQSLWLDKHLVLSELRGSPMERFYRLDKRRKAPKCKHDGTFAVVSIANFVFGGPTGKPGEAGMLGPEILCCKCGAMRHRRDGKSWSASLAHEMSDPLLQRDGFPEGSALVVHATNLRTDEEVDQAGDAAFAKWVDLEYGRRLLYGRLRQEDLPRAERDAAEYARAR
jgi:hypothetical protein